MGDGPSDGVVAVGLGNIFVAAEIRKILDKRLTFRIFGRLKLSLQQQLVDGVGHLNVTVSRILLKPTRAFLDSTIRLLPLRGEPGEMMLDELSMMGRDRHMSFNHHGSEKRLKRLNEFSRLGRCGSSHRADRRC